MCVLFSSTAASTVSNLTFPAPMLEKVEQAHLFLPGIWEAALEVQSRFSRGLEIGYRNAHMMAGSAALTIQLQNKYTTKFL